MEEQRYSRPGSEFDGKTLKEILEMIKDIPTIIEEIERAKKLLEQDGGGEKLRRAMFGEKEVERNS